MRYFVIRTLQRTGELESNGYQVTVSAEGNRSVNEWVSHHRVVSGVPRNAQTLAPRSHEIVQTLVCVIGSDEHQRVTETSKEQATQQTVFRSNLVVQSLYMISMYQGVVWVPQHV